MSRTTSFDLTPPSDGYEAADSAISCPPIDTYPIDDGFSADEPGSPLQPDPAETVIVPDDSSVEYPAATDNAPYLVAAGARADQSLSPKQASQSSSPRPTAITGDAPETCPTDQSIDGGHADPQSDTQAIASPARLEKSPSEPADQTPAIAPMAAGSLALKPVVDTTAEPVDQTREIKAARESETPEAQSEPIKATSTDTPLQPHAGDDHGGDKPPRTPETPALGGPERGEGWEELEANGIVSSDVAARAVEARQQLATAVDLIGRPNPFANASREVPGIPGDPDRKVVERLLDIAENRPGTFRYNRGSELEIDMMRVMLSRETDVAKAYVEEVEETIRTNIVRLQEGENVDTGLLSEQLGALYAAAHRLPRPVYYRGIVTLHRLLCDAATEKLEKTMGGPLPHHALRKLFLIKDVERIQLSWDDAKALAATRDDLEARGRQAFDTLLNELVKPGALMWADELLGILGQTKAAVTDKGRAIIAVHSWHDEVLSAEAFIIAEVDAVLKLRRRLPRHPVALPRDIRTATLARLSEQSSEQRDAARVGDFGPAVSGARDILTGIQRLRKSIRPNTAAIQALVKKLEPLTTISERVPKLLSRSEGSLLFVLLADPDRFKSFCQTVRRLQAEEPDEAVWIVAEKRPGVVEELRQINLDELLRGLYDKLPTPHNPGMLDDILTVEESQKARELLGTYCNVEDETP